MRKNIRFHTASSNWRNSIVDESLHACQNRGVRLARPSSTSGKCIRNAIATQDRSTRCGRGRIGYVVDADHNGADCEGRGDGLEHVAFKECLCAGIDVEVVAFVVVEEVVCCLNEG